MITQDRLKELVSYDPETGVFMRRVRTSNRVNMAKPMGTFDTAFAAHEAYVSAKREHHAGGTL